MKKTLRLTLLAVFLIGALILAGCGGASDNEADTPDKGQPTEQQRDLDPNEVADDADVDEVIDEANKTTLEELAELEKEWRDQLHNIVISADDTVDQWINGQVTYNKMIMELYELKAEVDQLFEQCQAVLEEKDFANKLKDEPIYTNRLVLGQKNRENVKEFFQITYDGIDSEGSAVDVSGDSFNELYNEKLINQYNNNYRYLTAAINSIQ
ncbi:hypothetical protein [Desulfofalx alkaliphila]|uniref:hypothetical protein n=1 Tax=Desulfofalx alkaliphila TaxID=105483 RepID=UPI0004E13249|nr:hypothetical protein [Desulfofalx alkaliphila]